MCSTEILIFLFISRNWLILVNLSKILFWVPISAVEGPHWSPFHSKLGPHFDKFRSPLHVGAVLLNTSWKRRNRQIKHVKDNWPGKDQHPLNNASQSVPANARQVILRISETCFYFTSSCLRVTNRYIAFAEQFPSTGDIMVTHTTDKRSYRM